MAQAARLNLRLQKELKLLLTDPPPGASFPSLSSSSSSSLSSFDAEIEGPQDTVYANGVFKLKIQIPDRYPFQPPIVTFATPIYHPNIDSGGRICLDILNLPPKGVAYWWQCHYNLNLLKTNVKQVEFSVKHFEALFREYLIYALTTETDLVRGAWQPSLNISTVVTSIGLLLSEPNPDDGLMHEVSNEYKYNRQAFDQKAKTMTEKYARPIESENASADEGNQSLANASSLPMEDKDMDVPLHEANDGFVNNNSICGTNRKLSLDYSGTDRTRNRSKEADEESVHHFAHNQTDTGELEQISKKNQIGNGGLEQISKAQSGETWRKYQQDMENLKPQPYPDEAAEWRSDCINANSLRLLIGDKKLMLQSVDLKHRVGNDAGNMFTVSEQSAFLSHSSTPHQTVSWTPISSHMETISHNGPVNRNGNDITSTHHKKLGLAGRRPRLGLGGSLQSELQNDKENLISGPPSNHVITFSMPPVMPEASEKENNFATSVSYKKLRGITCKQPLRPLNQLRCTDGNTEIKTLSESQSISKSNPLPWPGDPRPDEKLHCDEDHDKKFTDGVRREREEFPVSESIVVLDSEDSEDETKEYNKSKFLVARKRLLEKRKAKV